MKLDDGRLTFVAQQEVTALDAIHKAALGKAACAGRVTEGVGTCISIHAPTWGATYQTPNMTNPCRHFNPRTHVGCDFGAIFQGWSDPIFQSTHPRGVRPAFFGVQVYGRYFNPRTHVGCDYRRHNGCRLQTQISIHAPTWGATHKARLHADSLCISIHAPTWGATVKSRHAVRKVLISIHAPTWGATPKSFRAIYYSDHFNPRTHVGCDF